jgi:hypothetical protein
MAYDFIKELGAGAWSSCKRLLAAEQRGDKNDHLHVHLFAKLMHSRKPAALKSLRKRLVDRFFPGGVAAARIKFHVKLARGVEKDIKYVAGYPQKANQRAGYRLLHDNPYGQVVIDRYGALPSLTANTP